MIRQAIVLAGGLGTRLQSVVADLPKCMAPVNNKPFLFYVIDYLQKQGIEHIIFSLGYKHEHITSFLRKACDTLSYSIVIEEEPLGTGGAIKLSCQQATAENVLITNGDTLFKVDLLALSSFHITQESDCTLALKPMTNFDRYGVVKLKNDHSIESFEEKKWNQEGLINGGLYALNLDNFMQESLPDKFSFEKDYLETLYSKRRMYGIIQEDYFIDIGIPEDYLKAQQEL